MLFYKSCPANSIFLFNIRMTKQSFDIEKLTLKIKFVRLLTQLTQGTAIWKKSVSLEQFCWSKINIWLAVQHSAPKSEGMLMPSCGEEQKKLQQGSGVNFKIFLA